MLQIIIFNIVQFAASGYAIWRGGAPERVVACLLLMAGFASLAVLWHPEREYVTVNSGLFAIDVLLLVLLVVVASFANRYWPIWIAAVQLITVASHGARAWNDLIWARAYWLFSGYVAYLVVAMLAVGTVRHRQRLAAALPERAWAWSPRGGNEPIAESRSGEPARPARSGRRGARGPLWQGARD